jgi:hypothetical protein
MSERHHGSRLPVLTWALGAAVLGAGHLTAPPATGDEHADSKRSAVGKCISATGSAVRREALGKPWQLVEENETLHSGDLILGMPGAKLESRDGAVQLVFWTDLTGTSPSPVKETAVILHSQPGVDLDLTLDRGRVALVNHKKSGPAHVRLHVREDSWDMTLATPETAIALELFGRWPRGTRFTTKPGPKDVPTANLTFLVGKGEVMLDHDGVEHRMHAPPGPALIEWDSVTGMEETPHRLTELPAWAQRGVAEAPEVKERRLVREHILKAVQTQSISQVLDRLVNSDKPAERRFGVFAMAAMDDLVGLAKVMRETKYADVWDEGVLALRHWIGRGPGQDQKLYRALIAVGKYPPIDAETVCQLLHSFSEEDLARPEVYEALLDYMEDDRLSIRGLAYWHLKRIVRAGQKFDYDPTAPKEARETAIAKWKELMKKLIAAGDLPPRDKTDKKEERR